MSFRVAISGMRAATADLDVTGNNIANANTNGFKASRAQFADLYAASNLGTTKDAIGQGVKLSAVAQQFTQGSISFTDNSLDVAINGSGFFVLDDGGARAYSRAGAFGVDRDGFVVNATGQRLMSFQVTDNSITGAVGSLRIDTSNIAPSASTRLNAQVNVDAAADVPAVLTFDPANPASYNNATSIAVFDSLGKEHLANLYFRKTAANEWESHLRIASDPAYAPAGQAISFDRFGNLSGYTPQAFAPFDPGALTGANPFSLTLDLTGSTQYGVDFAVNELSQDGFSSGRLSGIAIDGEGIVLARYTNGQSRPQGQIALANFANPQGLQPLGDTIWGETSTSGAPLLGAPGTSSLGLIQAGALEEANVELAQQLVNMIVAQRNFQANAQVIRTEDEVTQTIINIR